MTVPEGSSNNIEDSFLKWFNGFYGPYSFRSEWFYGDCEVEDSNIRKELLYKWLLSAYEEGYNSNVKCSD